MIVILIAIFFVSASALGLELVLVRALSIGHWHHFSYLVISTALLGFGAGGTFIATGSKLFTRNYIKWLWFFAFGFALTNPIVFWLSQRIGFDELQLIWDWHQVVYLFACYLLFFVPFFCAGLFIALAFSCCGDKAHRLYFYNMTGSGLGAAGIVALMYGNSPEELILLLSCVACLSAILLAFKSSWRRVVLTLCCSSLCLLIFNPSGLLGLEIEISENKSLVYYRALPESETVAVRYSPLGRLDCVQARAVRHFPGLSIGYQGQLPEQMLIITDADGTTAVNQFDKRGDFECFNHMTSALAYSLFSGPEVCIIGAGGGGDVLQALGGGAKSITAVEVNPQIIDLVRNEFGDFASGLYDNSNVEIVIAEGRNFLQTTHKRFDIINISLLDSLSASAAGVYGLNESHLYTIEAIEQAFRCLQPSGVLSITRMLKTPPRDSLKMFATVTEALRRRGVSKPAEHIIMIRSWSTATIVVCPQPFTEFQIKEALHFASQRSFDIVHRPGILIEEINQFHVLPEPFYYESVQQILSVERESFYRDYAYNIRPATDDKPYFFDFFKWKSLSHMARTIPGRWLAFSEWGYLVLAATLLQAVLASTLFILLPLFIAKPIKAVISGKFVVLIYFLLLGLAYMFLEMGFIAKLTLLIGHPVFGVAVTLLGFLLFSGLGSLASGRFGRTLKSARLIKIAVFGIIVVGLVEIILLTLSFGWLVGLWKPFRLMLGLGITAPLAFFMGMPFPTAIKKISEERKPLVPWALGINGFASVTGAVLGTFFAISGGFTLLVLIALGCYFLAAIISRYMFSDGIN